MKYGMFTEYGDEVMNGLVIASKQLGYTREEVIEIMEDISTVRGMHEANDTVVRERVIGAIFGSSI